MILGLSPSGALGLARAASDSGTASAFAAAVGLDRCVCVDIPEGWQAAVDVLAGGTGGSDPDDVSAADWVLAQPEAKRAGALGVVLRLAQKDSAALWRLVGSALDGELAGVSPGVAATLVRQNAGWVDVWEIISRRQLPVVDIAACGLVVNLPLSRLHGLLDAVRDGRAGVAPSAHMMLASKKLWHAWPLLVAGGWPVSLEEFSWQEIASVLRWGADEATVQKTLVAAAARPVSRPSSTLSLSLEEQEHLVAATRRASVMGWRLAMVQLSRRLDEQMLGVWADSAGDVELADWVVAALEQRTAVDCLDALAVRTAGERFALAIGSTAPGMAAALFDRRSDVAYGAGVVVAGGLHDAASWQLLLTMAANHHGTLEQLAQLAVSLSSQPVRQ